MCSRCYQSVLINSELNANYTDMIAMGRYTLMSSKPGQKFLLPCNRTNFYRTTPCWPTGDQRQSVPNLSTRWPALLRSPSGDTSNRIH